MSVTIIRNPGLLGSPGFMTLKIEDQPDEKISGRSSELDLITNQTIIRAKLLGCKSNSLPVKDGQKVEVSTRFWPLISIILFVVLLNLSRQIIPSEYLFLFNFGLLATFVIINFVFPVYQLKLLPVIPNSN